MLFNILPDRFNTNSAFIIERNATIADEPGAMEEIINHHWLKSVSYTHLDVYKRQGQYPVLANKSKLYCGKKTSVNPFAGDIIL